MAGNTLRPRKWSALTTVVRRLSHKSRKAYYQDILKKYTNNLNRVLHIAIYIPLVVRQHMKQELPGIAGKKIWTTSQRPCFGESNGL